MLVIDASVVLAWCFQDERNPFADRILDRVRDAGGSVPSLWRLEVANVLLAAERRGRIKRADVEARLERLANLPIEIDEEGDQRVWIETLALARTTRLTVYDATYLELAMRSGVPLATLDADLATAAKRLGVTLAR